MNYGWGHLLTAAVLAGVGTGLRVYAESQLVFQERHDETLDALPGQPAGDL